MYQSSTAALHSAGYRIGSVRRRVIAKGLQPFRRLAGGLAGAPMTSWLSKPIHQQRATNVELANTGAPQARALNIPSKAQAAPEILGVIPERKNEEI